MNKGFLELIDLSSNIQRGIQAIRGINRGVAALMVIGLTIVTMGLLPIVWYFDIDATASYALPLINQVLPVLPASTIALTTWVIVIITALPTVIELFLPRIGHNVQSVAFLIFTLTGIDAITDYPRVHLTLLAYKPFFDEWGFFGTILWYAAHPVLLLFASLLFELILALCLSLIVVLVVKIASRDGG